MNLSRILSLALIAVLTSCDRQKPTLEKIATPVRVTAAEKYLPAQEQRYSASILPNRQVNLAFKTSGFVESIAQFRGADGRRRGIDLGDVAQAGTVLAEVRTKDYQLQVSQVEGQLKQAQQAGAAARAQLQQAQAGAQKAEQDYERASTLFKETSLTKSDYDAARANRDATRAQVEAAQAQVQSSSGTFDSAESALGSAKLALQDTSLVAPFTGAVVQRSVDVGSLAGPSMVAFVLADISSVKAAFAVSDIVVGNLRNGSKLSVYTEAFPNREFRGYVSAIAATADSSTRAFQVEVTLPNAHSLLRPGMIASLALGQSADRETVTVVPLNAIVNANANPPQFAVVVVQGGVARRKAVTLGATYGDRIAVNGIHPGEQVINSGASFVEDGDSVQVIP